MADRAVSETVGFVLVFALITMTIGIVYASGFAGLQSAQDSERLANVERAFDVLNDNLRDIHQERAPSRATEIKLAGGSLTVAEPIEMTFNTSSTEPGLCNATNPLSLSTRPLVYEDGQSSVTYVSGAMIRADGPDSVMVSEPAWIIHGDQSVISFIATTSQGTADSVGGDSTVLIEARQRSNSLRCSIDPGSSVTGNITVHTTSTNAGAWEGYFENQGYTVTRPADDIVIAEFTTEKLFVSRTSVRISILN